MKITKTAINKVLKEHGYNFIKVKTGDWTKPEKCFTTMDGKRVKGIKGGSIGPLTSTNNSPKNQQYNYQQCQRIS